MTSISESRSFGVHFSPLSVARALWNRKWLVAAVWLAGIAATVVAALNLRAIYTAQSLVLVESQKIPETFVAATVQVMLEARLDMLKQQVLSRDRLWSLIQEFDLYKEQRERLTTQEVLALMRKDVAISLERGWSASRPGAFRVSYTAYTPRTAAEVANRIAHFFIDENLRQREAEAKGTSEFLESQLAESKRQLQQLESRLSEYKTAFNGELPQQEAALIAAMGQSRVELLGTQDALARAQQNKLALENSLKLAEANRRERRELAALRAHQSREPQAEPAGTPQPEPTELELAQAQLRTLRLRYHDQHPEIQRLLRDVARLEKQAGETPAAPPPRGRTREAATASAPRPVAEPPDAGEADGIRELRSQLTLVTQEIGSLDARRQRILEEIADAQLKLKRVPIREQQQAMILRDYETSRASYASLLNKKLAADVAENMEREQKAEKFVMLDQARVPEKPTWPNRRMLMSAGGLGSLFLASVLAFLLELKKNVLLGEWELPRGVVVLARVPPLRIGHGTR